MENRDTLERTITALRERNIGYKYEDIESAFDNTSGAACTTIKWVSNHLNDETLLSKEETTLYSKLESLRILQPILQHPDLPGTKPFSEEDIRTSIELLKSSTAAIHRQTDSLKFQHESLRKGLRNDKEAELDRNKTLASLVRKNKFHKQGVDAAADDLKHDIETRLSAAKDTAIAEKRKQLAWVTNKLKADDRAFSMVERLMSELVVTGEDKAIRERVETLTSNLAQLVSEGFYCLLDRVYMETILSDEDGSIDSVGKENEQIAGLEEELESLYPEIEVLAEMSTKQQFSERILFELETSRAQSQSTLEKKLRHVLEMVVDMTLSTQRVKEQLVDSQLYYEALAGFSNTYMCELDKQPSTPAPRYGRFQSDSVPRSTLSNFDQKQPPGSQAVDRFLRRLGVSPDPRIKFSEQDNFTNPLYEKRRHMTELLHNLGMAADSPLVAQLDPTHGATELLDHSLHADSDYQISLVDASQTEELVDLEKKLVTIQRGVEGLNLEILHQRDKAHEKFIERWQ